MSGIKLARLALCAMAALGAGCATIISKSSQTFTVTSVPDGAALTITNAAGVAVHNGNTPMTVTLKKGRGYFKPEIYTLSFTKPGYTARSVTVRGEVNGWYFGNILFGGLIGMLAVDPATGAMYTLTPKQVNATLDAMKVADSGREHSLTVVLVKDLPAQYVSQLIPLDRN